MLAGWASSGAPRSARRRTGRLWAAGDPPPFGQPAIDVLIGGAAYFPVLEQAIRNARRSVLIAGVVHHAGVRARP